MGEEFTIVIPEGCSISNIGFATALVEKASTFTSEDISLIVDSKTVDLKSILGVITLQYYEGAELKFRVIGEMANYAKDSLTRFVNKLFTLYIKE